MRRTFFWLSSVLAPAITAVIAINSAKAQTAQTQQMAYVQLSSCSVDDTTGILSCANASIVTPFGETAGPNDTEPTWSPDAKQIAFTRNPWPFTAGVASDIFVASASGSNPVNITNTANNMNPRWSPGGSRIAFTTTRDGHYELYLMNPDGSNVVRLTHNVGFYGDPVWSHDGTRIAFDCQVDTGNDDICAINSDGTGFVRLTTDSASESDPTWSPDSQSIAFVTTQYPSGGAVMNADGSDVRQLTLGGDTDLAWSPDGAQIAFDGPCYDAYGNPEFCVYKMNADGTGVALFAQSAEEPAWMPAQVPIATFKVSCTGDTCNFDASGSTDSYGTITSYAWNFGDGLMGTGASVAHTYAGGGNDTVKLVVTDNNGATGTKFQTFTIGPTISFTSSCSGLTCSFDGSGSKDSTATIINYAWNFGDGVTAAGATVSHTYALGNAYKVTLTVTDNTGFTATQSQTVNVNAPPVASFTFACNYISPVTRAPDPLTCGFDGSSSNDRGDYLSYGGITNLAWNFGDGGTAVNATFVTHTYAAGGQYTVTLTVTDNGGAINSQSQTVIVNSPPVASFTVSCSKFTCTFNGSSSFDSDGTITNYAWKFGDGTTTSGGASVAHAYRTPGTYTVTLTVTDNGGATGVQSDSVSVVPPGRK
jgi:PKD repeat protein